MKICTVIMAGGVGTRFWPYSREAQPKQLLDVLHRGRSLLQQTIDRTSRFSSFEETIIITGKTHIEGVKEQVPEIPDANIIAEPFGRNTAPCIALASKIIKERFGSDAVMVVLPADHIVKNDNEFVKLITLGARLAHTTKGLVTLGIHPTRPETGYGYIQLDDERLPSNSELPEFSEFELREVFRVRRFAEKPDHETAQRFVESGDFLWNSGMFVWRADAICKALETYSQDIMSLIDPLPANDAPDFTAKLKDAYSKIRGVSIDYAVMERASNVFVLRASALGWSDLGSWDEVWRLSEKDLNNNVIDPHANTVVRASKGSLVLSKSDQLIVLNGVSDLVVVHSGDAILITHRDKAQSVKDVADYLKRNARNEYL